MAGALLHQDPVVTCLHETTAVGARAAVARSVSAAAVALSDNRFDKLTCFVFLLHFPQPNRSHIHYFGI